jgi:hypothetical protein
MYGTLPDGLVQKKLIQNGLSMIREWRGAIIIYINEILNI